MFDEISVGCTPASEDCAQVGSDGYYERAMKECRAYINQLRRVYGEEPDGAKLKIKAFPHDYGSYHEVVCRFNENNEDAAEYAYKLEEGCDVWDDEAKKELGLV